MTTQTPRIQLTLGVNAPALSLPGADQVRGLLINNPSGAWLLLRTTNEFIPPYTIGFARSFEFGHTSIAIEFPATGPAGQISTLAGDRPDVQLFSDPVGNSAGNSSGGTSFVEQFTPYLTATWALNATKSAGIINTGIINPIANKRIRIIGIIAWLDTTFGGNGPAESGAKLLLFPSDGSGAPFLSFHLTVRDVEKYTTPTDYPLSSGVNYTLTCDWADVFIWGTITYQVI